MTKDDIDKVFRLYDRVSRFLKSYITWIGFFLTLTLAKDVVKFKIIFSI